MRAEANEQSVYVKKKDYERVLYSQNFVSKREKLKKSHATVAHRCLAATCSRAPRTIRRRSRRDDAPTSKRAQAASPAFCNVKIEQMHAEMIKICLLDKKTNNLYDFGCVAFGVNAEYKLIVGADATAPWISPRHKTSFDASICSNVDRFLSIWRLIVAIYKTCRSDSSKTP